MQLLLSLNFPDPLVHDVCLEVSEKALGRASPQVLSGLSVIGSGILERKDKEFRRVEA